MIKLIKVSSRFVLWILCNGKIRQNGILSKGRIVFTESAMDPIISWVLSVGFYLFILIELILLYDVN